MTGVDEPIEVFVNDVVDAFCRAAESGAGVYNIGTGVETSVNELYSAMAQAAGVDSPAVHAEARVGELSRSSLDPGRAVRELGWSPATSLADGTAAVLEWFGARR